MNRTPWARLGERNFLAEENGPRSRKDKSSSGHCEREWVGLTCWSNASGEELLY